MSLPSLTVQELKAEIESGKSLVLVDVREPHEVEAGAIPGILHIPLGEIPTRFGELDANAETVVICKLGGRSGQATQFLLDQGFTRVRNLTGGTTAWSNEIDPSVVVV